MKVKNQEQITITDAKLSEHEKHLSEKLFMREEKKCDNANTNPSSLLIVFDLEKVIILPKAEVSSFFYKRKLTMYNRTAQTNHKKGYCAIWTEVASGRAGNDIASAFVSILRKIVEDNPAATDLICWSDSCVPQNRNSHFSDNIRIFIQ